MKFFTRCRLFVLLVLTFLFSTSSFCQIDLTVNTFIDNVNEKVFVSVTADGFTDMETFQGSFEYNESAYELDTMFLTSLVNDPALFPTFFHPQTPDRITFSWIPGDLLPVTLPPGSEIFRAVFSIKSLQSGNFCLSDIPTPIQFSDANGLILRYTITCENDKGLLKGHVYGDQNDNCQLDQGENSLENWTIEAIKDNTSYYTTSDENGDYFLFLEPGDYELKLIPPSSYWILCRDTINFTLDDAMDTENINLGAQAAELCPDLAVDISTPLLRRCFPSKYYIHYCNNGTSTAENAFINVELDPSMDYITSTITPSSQNGQMLTFPIGDVSPGACDQMEIEVIVDCDNTVIGQTHCSTATIFPNGPCGGEEKPIITIHPSCTGTEVSFSIKNEGNMDMDEKAYLIPYADDELLSPSFIQLAGGEEKIVRYPADGKTYRINIRKDNIPESELLATAGLEGCDADGDGQFSTGYLNAFSLAALNDFTDTDCTENRGSYDPNDKQGLPKGLGTNKVIRPGAEMEYLIRFQNTGTDTAFKVVILDTLNSNFDPRKLRLGAASHSMEFKLLEKGILKFTFNNIMLPDSSTNEPASHGFVKYYIHHNEGLELPSELTNQASIYFDFNDPIVTNTTLHTLNEPEIIVNAVEVKSQKISLKTYPNPATNFVQISVHGIKEEALKLFLHEINGRVVKEVTSQGNQFLLEKGNLSAGLYHFTITGKRKSQIASGKLIFN